MSTGCSPSSGEGRSDRLVVVSTPSETARGMANVEEICAASPRMQGLSLGPADLAASRRMKTTGSVAGTRGTSCVGTRPG